MEPSENPVRFIVLIVGVPEFRTLQPHAV